ncbi:LysR family transcriptional regulator [Rhizorhapis sp. SPR117]|uniref:LysR family transcriptional regulator n=1 Tax=Rhizorhapis sp. SPR117 TaxID=2912611 RepID=UPI001F492834|nr:LysR family transcriptional regulator [Rhizorhapis sp. SPR117]
MANITLRQLEIFVQVVQHGSFRSCARQVGVSQVAISDHIRQLEERLGHALFKRVSGGPSTLTPAGERAFRHASQVLSAMAGLMQDMTGAEADTSDSKLVIAAHSAVLRYFQETLAQFEEDHPNIGIELDLDTFTAAPLAQKMREGTVDIGFFYALEASPQLESTLMWHEPLALFVSRDHILAQQEQVSVDDLLNFPVIRLGATNPQGLLIDEAMEQAGLSRCAIALETDNYGEILTGVRNGLGFLCMFESSAGDLLNLGGMKRIAFSGALPDIEVRRAIRPPWRDDPVVAKLLQSL